MVRELMKLRMERNAARAVPYKPLWAACKFKDKFGEFPPFAWNTLAPAANVSAEVRSWVRSRDIAYSKRMAKERGS
jgi:hypothetical protein